MATTENTRKAAKKSASRRSVAAKSDPRVGKKLARAEARAPKPEEPPEKQPEEPKVDAYLVELVEGTTYEVGGKTFASDRPVVITEPRLLRSVLTNGRFKCRRAGGG